MRSLNDNSMVDECNKKEDYVDRKEDGSEQQKTLVVEQPMQVKVRLSKADTAPQLKLSDDGKVVTGEKGYRMTRANVGVSKGVAFYEAYIQQAETADAHVRLGWATSKADIQAPVGFDCHGFAYRDIGGSSVHNSLRNDSYGDAFGPGDVIGVMISLQKEVEHSNPSNGCSFTKTGIQLGNPFDSSRWIKFFKNGIDQGIAYSQLPEDEFFPAVSVYQGCIVELNFEGNYKFPPDANYGWSSVGDASTRSIA